MANITMHSGGAALAHAVCYSHVTASRPAAPEAAQASVSNASLKLLPSEVSVPGPYIHMSAMRNAAERLARRGYSPAVGRAERVAPDWAGPDIRALAETMRRHPNFASLGAIGPDLFFFLPDFRDKDGVVLSSVLTKVLQFLEDLYGAVDPYITKWEKYIGPLSEDNAEEISRLTGGLSESVSNITGELSSILISALEDFVTKQYDWFGEFALGLNQGFDEQLYYWSDMLHYRGTGQFGRALWRNANAAEDDRLIAYSLGYITHLATDVTGHAYINAIAGGPYRQHWQRHHLVENHCDAFWYLEDSAMGSPRTIDGYTQITKSALYIDIAFAEDDQASAIQRPSFPMGDTLRENWTRRRLLDKDSSLPDELASLLLQSMKDVFYTAGAKHPGILPDNDGRPSSDQVTTAYDLLFRFLKLTTVDGFSHEPPPPPPVFGNLQFPTPTDPGADSSPADGAGGGGGGGGFSWDDLLDLILAIVNAIGYVLEVVAYLLTLPWAIIADVLNYPWRYIMYLLLELPLFHMLKDFRAVLVLTGYMAPMEDEIVSGLVQIGTTSAESFAQVVAEMGDVFGGIGQPPPPTGNSRFVPPVFPTLNSSSPDDADLEYHHPWEYPRTGPEPDPTTPGPYALGAQPSVLFADIQTDPDLRDKYETATSPRDTESHSAELSPARSLGDVVTFSEYLLWLMSRDDSLYNDGKIKATDWNLDADRGYAHKCWDWNRDSARKGTSQQSSRIFTYFCPCSPPSQTDTAGSCGAFNWKQPSPLQCHYVEASDPGCMTEPQPPR
jgi:hypothetical protein